MFFVYVMMLEVKPLDIWNSSPLLLSSLVHGTSRCPWLFSAIFYLECHEVASAHDASSFDTSCTLNI